MLLYEPRLRTIDGITSLIRPVADTFLAFPRRVVAIIKQHFTKILRRIRPIFVAFGAPEHKQGVPNGGGKDGEGHGHVSSTELQKLGFLLAIRGGGMLPF